MIFLRDTDDFTTLRTTSILPVDLNAFILGVREVQNTQLIPKIFDQIII